MVPPGGAGGGPGILPGWQGKAGQGSQAHRARRQLWLNFVCVCSKGKWTFKACLHPSFNKASYSCSSRLVSMITTLASRPLLTCAI